MKLDANNRDIIYFPKNKDITIIEVKSNDIIYQYIEFLNYDMNYKNGYKIYKNIDVFSVEHPLGESAACASGKIINLNGYEFSHTIPTDNGSSGCPIILLNNNINFIQVIGIHKESDKTKKLNYGAFIAEIFKANINNNINENVIINNSNNYDSINLNINQNNHLINNRMKFNTTKEYDNILNKLDKKIIEKIIAIKITYLFIKLLKAKRKEHNKLYKYFSQIYTSEIIIGLDNTKLDVDLAPEEKLIYIGTTFNKKKDGLGLELFNNTNAKYFGIFLNGRRKYFGIFNINNNLKNYCYYGEIQGIYAYGYGWLIDKKENKKYEGLWENSMKNRYGIEKYNDNSEYRGCFLNGKKEGIGIYKWKDNSFYEGEWRDNKLNGYGIYKFSDSTEYEGQLEKNNFNGIGVFTSPGIKKYYGFFKEDKRYGFGIEIWFKTQKAIIGYWKNNKINGFGKFMFNDKIRYGIWKGGKLVEKKNKKDFFKQMKDKHIPFLKFFQIDNYKDVLNFIEEII